MSGLWFEELPVGLVVEHATRRTVSPWNTGAGKNTSVRATWATIVPSVSSGTEIPTTSARVNMLFTSGRPNSVVAA